MPPPATALPSRVPAATPGRRPPTAPALTWNATLRLWGRDSAGHTHAVAHLPRVHSGVESAVKLLALAQLDKIDQPGLDAAISGLLELQSLSGPFTGCFRWYAEETEPTDTNASFFIGLALQLLALARPEHISPVLRPRLRAAFAHLNAWFLDELGRESPVYPNKYLGDLVCAWLGHELLDQIPPPSLENAFERALTYWDSEHWGWGEHQSDIYAGVILAEFSALLLFARRLPPALREHALHLARKLLALDDFFGAGPRVPQIRCYDFTHAPARLAFRTQVETPWPAAPSPDWIDSRALRRYMLLPFGPLFRERGWGQLFPAATATPTTTLTIPLAGDAAAHAFVTHRLRTGSLSRWPILPGTEHQRWGLSWQTFAAAFWRPDESWGFLRFTTRRSDDLRAHPALDKARAYLTNTLGPGEPPPVGLTACAQSGPAWLALRALPPGPWDETTDGFWLHQLPVAPVLERADADWTTLRLDHPEGALRLHHFPAPGQTSATLALIDSGAWRWTARASKDTALLHLWALTTGPAPATRPLLRFGSSTCVATWPEFGWHATRLHLRPPA